MKIPFSLPFGKKETFTYFLILLLREEKQEAVIFEESLRKVRIVGQGKAAFADSIETASLEAFLSVLDQAISEAERTLPEGVEVQKTVFGVNEYWVEGAKIKKEYLAKLKQASEKLGLSPLGFLVVHEAIAHLVQEEEGAPVSAILVDVEKEHLAVTLLRAGRLVSTKRTKIEDDVVKTVDRLLHHFQDFEVLPSRIMLFGNGETETIAQQFIAHAWSKALPFLHVPQVVVLPADFGARAVLFGAAKQMGFEVEETETEPLLEETSIEDFGFAKEEDVAVETQVVEKPKSEPPRSDIQTIALFSPAVLASKRLAKRLLATLLSVRRVFPQLSVPFQSFVYVPLLLAAVALGVVFGYIFLLKATVVIRASPKVVEQQIEITFSSRAKTDVSARVVEASFIKTSQPGSSITRATGKKDVGDKAKGTVTIYSRLAEERVFPQETTITSQNDLAFTLDNQVRLASTSADASSTPTTAKVAVTAKQIGKEYNLPSGTRFSILQLSQAAIVAKNESPFSGGSKRETSAVAKEDVDKLASELPKTLEAKAKDALLKTLPPNTTLLPRFIEVTLTNKQLSRNVGDEAEQVTMAATVSFQAIVYKKEALALIIQELLKKKLSSMLSKEDGFDFALSNLSKTNEQEVAATMQVKAKLLPKFDRGKLAEKISGKTFSEAEEILLQLPQVADVRFFFSPNIPFLPKKLPKQQNISFTITHE